MLCLRAAQACTQCASHPWSLSGSPVHLRPSGLVWSGDNTFVRGTWRPPSLVEKLLSGTRDQGDCSDSVFSEEICLPRNNTLCECFNNVDVGVPLWLTEPRDKSRAKSLLSLIPLFKPLHLLIAIFVCLYFHRV